ncbi:uncharacterized protein LOC111337035 [Stylophora pistillata]|uniref:uncharacterized protein LOC111337035 n=1 Tax=Stylophora pistillata TaxID=50429 RepID=UPI000C0526A4|nr:uncharacterized protein LOC111337035 [Stylophora pistillata]
MAEKAFIVGLDHAPIPAKLVRKIVEGQFVELADLFTANLRAEEQEPQTFLEGKLVVSSSKHRQVEIKDILTWTEAFAIFQLVMCAQDAKKEQKLEEIPDEVLFLVERGLEGTKKIWPMVWDFAGQAVYHAIHPIFLLQEDLYVLVSDLTQELCTPAQCRVRTHNDEKVVESPHDEDTNLDHMMRWLDLVHSLVKKKSESLRGNLPSDAPLASLPPVVLVGTHADGVTNPREKMDFVFKTICNKASRATVEHISKESFFIDNSNPNRDNDRQIVSLRKELLDLCERMPHINNEIPLQWLRVEEKIHQMVTDRQVRYVCKKSFKEDIAEGICQINNTDDVEELLHFLQARGSVIYQDHPEKPDGLVVLDPEWLIRVLSMIITVSPPWKNDPSIQKDYEFLKRRGLLSQQLLNRAFKHLELEGIRDSLIHIMEKFLVICDSKNCNGKEYPYFVPFMLRSPIKDTRGPKVQNGPLPVFLKFNTKYIPSGLFCRLGVLFWHWASKFYPHCKAPAFYANAARFQVSEDYHLILKCHRTVIKLAIWTRRDSDAEKEQSLCEELLSHLEHCKSELSITCRWLQSVTWELHVQCSLCEPCPKKSRVGTDICIWHGQEGCRHDDCGHYLKLRSLGLSASCKYCVDDVPHLSAEKLEPWTQALVSFKCKEKNGKRKRKMSPECSNKRPNQPEGKKRRQMLPGCSGKRLKQPKVKKGKPKEDELEELGYEIGEDWMVLGRRLGVTKPEIQNLKQQPDKLAERAYQMLLKWKQTKGCDATYQALNDALLHRFVQRKDLAERICLNKV